MEKNKPNIRLLMSCWIFTILTWISFLDVHFFFQARIVAIIFYLLLLIVAVNSLFRISSLLHVIKQKCKKEQVLYGYYFIVLCLYSGSYIYSIFKNWIIS